MNKKSQTNNKAPAGGASAPSKGAVTHNNTSRRKARNQDAFTRTVRSFTNIRSSPWRTLNFTVLIQTDPGRWGAVPNHQIFQALYDHLGISTGSNRYLEIKYQRVTVRAGSPGTALGLRVYRVPSSKDEVPNVTMSVESYASSSVAYAVTSLNMDAVSKKTPIDGDNTAPIFAVFPHFGEAKDHVAKIKLAYRHMEVPAKEPTTFAVIKIDHGEDPESAVPENPPPSEVVTASCNPAECALTSPLGTTSCSTSRG